MLYMTSADLDTLAQKLRTAFPMLDGYAADPSLAGFFAMVNAGIDRQIQSQMPAQMQGQMRNRTSASMHARSMRARPMPRAAATRHPDTPPGASAASSVPSADAAPAAFDLGAIDMVLNGMLADTGGAKYVSPWQSMMQANAQDSAQGHGYLVSDNGKYLLLQVAPGDGSRTAPIRPRRSSATLTRCAPRFRA